MTAVAAGLVAGSLVGLANPASAYPVPAGYFDTYAQCLNRGAEGAWYGYWSYWYCDVNTGSGPWYVLMAELANG